MSGAQVILEVGGDRERRVQEAFDRQHALVLHRTAPHRTAPHRTALLQPVHYGHFETSGRHCVLWAVAGLVLSIVLPVQTAAPDPQRQTHARTLRLARTRTHARTARGPTASAHRYSGSKTRCLAIAYARALVRFSVDRTQTGTLRRTLRVLNHGAPPVPEQDTSKGYCKAYVTRVLWYLTRVLWYLTRVL